MDVGVPRKRFPETNGQCRVSVSQGRLSSEVSVCCSRVGLGLASSRGWEEVTASGDSEAEKGLVPTRGLRPRFPLSEAD